jgi:hypothetical protein
VTVGIVSYNVAICIPPVPADDTAAWNALDDLIEAQGVVPPIFKDLYDRLTSKYSCIIAICPTTKLTTVSGATADFSI